MSRPGSWKARHPFPPSPRPAVNLLRPGSPKPPFTAFLVRRFSQVPQVPGTARIPHIYDVPLELSQRGVKLASQGNGAFHHHEKRALELRCSVAVCVRRRPLIWSYHTTHSWLCGETICTDIGSWGAAARVSSFIAGLLSIRVRNRARAAGHRFDEANVAAYRRSASKSSSKARSRVQIARQGNRKTLHYIRLQ